MVFKKGDKIRIGCRLSDETKKKIGEANKVALKGRNLSDETIKKISARLRGNTNSKGRVLTEEHKHRIGEANSKALLGKHLSEEAKQKLSKANKGRILSEEIKRKISEAQKGKKISEERKKKQSEKMIGRVPWNKGKKGGISWNKGKKMSKDACEKMSIARMGKTPWNKGKPFKGLEAHHNWKGGISFEPYCPKFNDRLKEAIRERDNRTCQLCGVKENGKKLSVHHVHYDKPNCDPDLIALCIGCNSKVNYNRDYYEELFVKKLEERGLLCNQNVKSSQSN